MEKVRPAVEPAADDRSAAVARLQGWPEDFVERLAVEPMLRWFEFGHLPDDLAAVSEWFCSTAQDVVVLLPRTPERTVALRKLLEAKDAAVRCALEARDGAR